jgi:hypothetical protein
MGWAIGMFAEEVANYSELRGMHRSGGLGYCPLQLWRRPRSMQSGQLRRCWLSRAVICGDGQAGYRASPGPNPSDRAGRGRLSHYRETWPRTAQGQGSVASLPRP